MRDRRLLRENRRRFAHRRPSEKFDTRAKLWQGARLSSLTGVFMPKAEWGTKRVCPTTGKRFYDLGRTPIISPYTGEVVDIESVRRKMTAAIARGPADTGANVLVDDLETDDVLLEDTTAEEGEVADDLLEEDADDNVSLDDLADVPAEPDEG